MTKRESGMDICTLAYAFVAVLGVSHEGCEFAHTVSSEKVEVP